MKKGISIFIMSLFVTLSAQAVNYWQTAFADSTRSIVCDYRDTEFGKVLTLSPTVKRYYDEGALRDVTVRHLAINGQIYPEACKDIGHAQLYCETPEADFSLRVVAEQKAEPFQSHLTLRGYFFKTKLGRMCNYAR